MSVALVNSPIYMDGMKASGDEYLPPFGLGYLATKLIDNNIKTIIVDAVKDGLSTKELKTILERIGPKMIGINIFSINIKIVKWLIENYGKTTRFIIGGQCTKYIYSEILTWQTSNEIIIVIGEGDNIILDIVNNQVKEKSIFSDNKSKVYYVDKNSIYFPYDLNLIKLNRNIFKEELVKNYHGLNEISILTSRGCCYDCAFCGAANSLNKDNRIRIKSYDKIYEEISCLLKNKAIECIRVLDDLFLRGETSIKEAIDIFNSFDVKWRAMAHVKSFSQIDDDILLKLRKSGCIELFIGIESGSNRIRNYINKLGKRDDVESTITKLLKVGINVKGYFIYGFPTETEEDMEESFKLAKSIMNISKRLCGNFRTSVFHFKPYHGTKLYNILRDNNMILDEFTENKKLTSMIDRAEFNSFMKNYSCCDDDILYEYIAKTSKIGDN